MELERREERGEGSGKIGERREERGQTKKEKEKRREMRKAGDSEIITH